LWRENSLQSIRNRDNIQFGLSRLQGILLSQNDCSGIIFGQNLSVFLFFYSSPFPALFLLFHLFTLLLLKSFLDFSYLCIVNIESFYNLKKEIL